MKENFRAFRELLDEIAITSRELDKSLDEAKKALQQIPPRPKMKLPDYFMTEPAGRAGTETAKGDVLARLWDAWQDCAPQMRLGQFIYNAISASMETGPDVELKRTEMDTAFFYTEDYDLIEIIEKYAGTMKGKQP